MENQKKQIQSDDKLRKAQKLEILGTLASGIAHDFNNQLTVVLGNVALSLDTLGPKHPVYDGLVEAQQAAQRCSEMTRGILTFSQTVKPELRPISLDQLLESTQRLLRRVIPSSISVRFEKIGHFQPILADASQLQQVIMNLAVNVRKAMPEGSLLEVKAENGPKCVMISVSDSGSGTSSEFQGHAFEPLSATAVKQGGTGLGLARDLEIVKAHGGWLDFGRSPEGGSTFRVSIPLPNRMEKTELPTPIIDGTECILVAEDEELVRRAAVKMLQRRGYQVIEARDGEDAVQRFCEHSDEVDVVFLDLTMPKCSGLQALEQIWQIRPGTKALLASGYMVDVAAHFLPKPYSPRQLIRKIQEVLRS